VFRSLLVVLTALAIVVALGWAPSVGEVEAALTPVDPGVSVDLSNEGEDVLGCLVDEMGYKPLPGGRLPSGPGHLEVTKADRAECGRRV
jgi:hypothetical protein